MRDYLYIWNDPKRQCIVASGIEFSDFGPGIQSACGLILLKHRAFDIVLDRCVGLDCLPIGTLSQLLAKNIYSWGDFYWVDFAPPELRTPSKQEVAELLYFAHMQEPLGDVQIGSIGNRFLAASHDDGWYLKCYYSSWAAMSAILENLPLLHERPQLLESIRSEPTALWITASVVEREERTFGIDSILNRKFR